MLEMSKVREVEKDLLETEGAVSNACDLLARSLAVLNTLGDKFEPETNERVLYSIIKENIKGAISVLS